MQAKPVLQVPVDAESELGLLGIAVMNSSNLLIHNSNSSAANNKDNNYNKNRIVFLYYTQSIGGKELRNRVYKYTWIE